MFYWILNELKIIIIKGQTPQISNKANKSTYQKKPYFYFVNAFYVPMCVSACVPLVKQFLFSCSDVFLSLLGSRIYISNDELRVSLQRHTTAGRIKYAAWNQHRLTSAKWDRNILLKSVSNTVYYDLCSFFSVLLLV